MIECLDYYYDKKKEEEEEAEEGGKVLISSNMKGEFVCLLKKLHIWMEQNE